MANKIFLDQAGLERLVNYINAALDQKADVNSVITPTLPNDLVHTSDLDLYALKSDLDELELDGYATEEDITRLEGLINGVYHFRGTVQDLTALQAVENPAVGDVYNIGDTGMNAAWTGTAWDEFGSIVDLSDYLTAAEVQAIALDTVNRILFSGKSAVVNDKAGVSAMIANNQPKVEITLNDDIAMTESIVVPAGKEVVLHLNGNEISSGSAQAIIASGEGSKLVLQGEGIITSNTNSTVSATNGGEVVIDGVSIISTTSNGTSAHGAGSKITVQSGEITAQEVAVLVIDGGDAEVNGGTLRGVDNYAIGGNGSAGRGNCNVTINGGTFEGHITSPGYQAAAIYWPNSGTLNFNAGTIITDGAGIVQRGGTINIGADVVIQASDTPTNVLEGKVGDARQVVGRYAIVYDYNSKYPDYQNMQLNIDENAQLSGVDGDLQIFPADAPGITDNR